MPLLLSLLYLLVVAFLVRVFAPERRRYLRVSVTFTVFALCCGGLALLAT